MKVQPTDLTNLLAVQEADSAIAALKQKAASLPILAEIKTLSQQRATVGDRLIDAQTKLSDAEQVAGRAEADVEPVRQRLVRNQARVDAGEMDAKALANAIDEIAHLKTRISDLEDAQLTSLDAVDQAQTTANAVSQEAVDVEADLNQALARRDQELARLVDEVKQIEAKRAELTHAIPADLLGLYDKIRARAAGVGVARFEGRRCLGCGLEATVVDANRYAATPADELIRCAECDRILVR